MQKKSPRKISQSELRYIFGGEASNNTERTQPKVSEGGTGDKG